MTTRKKQKRRGRATEIDVHVGQKVRQFRTLSGWSQTRLGDELGLTFQQVQKYERGTNRISAGRIWVLAEMFGVQPNSFFEGLNTDRSGLGIDPEMINRRESLELLRNYYKSPKKPREAAYALIKAMAKGASQ